MEKLSVRFTKTMDGKKIIFNQEKRTELPEQGKSVCIYSLTKEGSDQPYAFEAIIPRIQKNDINMPSSGYVSKAGEKYPGSNDFGPKGLHFAGIGTVEQKWERALKGEQELINSIVKSNKKQLVKSANKTKKDAENID